MAITRKMKFKNSGSMNRFLLLYMDLFVPYSEATIVQANYTGSKGYFNEKHNFCITERGEHDENISSMMRKGYKIISNELVDIHIEPENFRQIENLFKKEQWNRNRYWYVFEG